MGLEKHPPMANGPQLMGGAGTQMVGCGRPRVPPEVGLDSPWPLEMLELPSGLELPPGPAGETRGICRDQGFDGGCGERCREIEIDGGSGGGGHFRKTRTFELGSTAYAYRGPWKSPPL